MLNTDVESRKTPTIESVYSRLIIAHSGQGRRSANSPPPETNDGPPWLAKLAAFLRDIGDLTGQSDFNQSLRGSQIFKNANQRDHNLARFTEFIWGRSSAGNAIDMRLVIGRVGGQPRRGTQTILNMVSVLFKTFLPIALVATVVIAPAAGGAHATCERERHRTHACRDAAISWFTPSRLDQGPRLATACQSFQLHFRKSRERPTHPNPVLVAGDAHVTEPRSVLYVQRAGLSLCQRLLSEHLYLRDERSRAYRPNSGSDQAIARGSGTRLPQQLSSIVAYGFFQTIDMRRNLAAAGLTGTLPIIYVFLARSGKTITDVSLVKLDDNGTAQVDDGAGNEAHGVGSARGVKIDFAGDDGHPQTLYYFSVNVDNDGFEANGFARFCEHLGTGDAFVKSASYLMHQQIFPMSAVFCSSTLA
jgi:hypothetical protein